MAGVENLGQRLNMAHSVAVIGAGWAGCAAAVTLARRGARVTLFESARIPGGRARRVEHDGLTLDNGQHILLGAYRDTLHMMSQVGVPARRALRHLPLQMCYPDPSGMDLRAPRLPAPLHLAWGVLRARGLSAADKLSLARFSTAARWMGWQLHADTTVATLLERFDQTERVIALLWRPLCVAALNTPPERASARVFLNVLRDSLGAARSASDMLLPTGDLSALFPEPAIAWLEKHGARVRLGQQVRALQRAERGWRVSTDDAEIPADSVIVATSAAAAHKLCEPIDTLLAQSLRFEYEPITTCYLRYARSLQLARPFFALRDEPAQARWGQFVFDRGQLDASQAGLLAVVVSASSEAISLGHALLAEQIASQLAQDFQRPELAAPQWAQIITDKRATFSCTPDLPRPDNATTQPGLYLAGDYTASAYPATIESAVRSGLAAAALALKQL